MRSTAKIIRSRSGLPVVGTESGPIRLNVDFGCEVDIDKCVIYARADFPHDDVWQSGTLEFSDGSTVDIELRPTAEPQEFKFDKRRVTSVRLTNLKPNFPLKWCGITEIEYWGVPAPWP